VAFHADNLLVVPTQFVHSYPFYVASISQFFIFFTYNATGFMGFLIFGTSTPYNIIENTSLDGIWATVQILSTLIFIFSYICNLRNIILNTFKVFWNKIDAEKSNMGKDIDEEEDNMEENKVGVNGKDMDSGLWFSFGEISLYSAITILIIVVPNVNLCVFYQLPESFVNSWIMYLIPSICHLWYMNRSYLHKATNKYKISKEWFIMLTLIFICFLGAISFIGCISYIVLYVKGYLKICN
jgi:hypothetical protein